MKTKESEIILKALYNCALKYSKGFSRWQYMWQDRTTYEQQAESIAEELHLMGVSLIPGNNEK